MTMGDDTGARTCTVLETVIQAIIINQSMKRHVNQCLSQSCSSHLN